MANGEPKSSEDLIREANERLRGAQTESEPSIETPVDDPADETAPEREPIRYDPVRRAEADEPADAPIETRPGGSAVAGNLIRWGLALLVFGGWFLFTRLDDASRDDTGEIVSGGDLDVMTMQVGDCFNDPEGDEEAVVDVAAVPCSEPHDNEVFAVLSLEAAFPDDPFPGQDAMLEHSYEVCSGSVFDSYVGTAYLDSSLEVFSFTPTEESWDNGDRGFVCALYRLDFGQLTGTARDSGL